MGKIIKSPPNHGKLEQALRSLGYTLETAVADIVDNSIDAKAETIVIRLVEKENGKYDFVIWDDGDGMTKEVLFEAMRWGSEVSEKKERLGKYGLGLKAASLGHAESLNVVSFRCNKISGMSWPKTGIKDGFQVIELNESESNKLVKTFGKGLKWNGSGTLVHWETLTKVGQNNENPKKHVQKLIKTLQDHLSLAFHRFLSGRPTRIRINLDVLNKQTGELGIAIPLTPLNPFGYTRTGHKDYPKNFVLEGGTGNLIEVKAHIWPAKSNSSDYLLPGGANPRQGFYFYRNNRLIQGGGWNSTRQIEPHSSLARVEIDIAPDVDFDVNLDIKKTNINLDETILDKIKKSKSSDGTSYSDYLKIAQNVYKKQAPEDKDLPVVPISGVPKRVSTLIKSLLKDKRYFKKLDFQWVELPKEMILDVDSENCSILLNTKYRNRICGKEQRRSDDIPFVKTLIFYLCESMLRSKRRSKKADDYLRLLNLVLLETLKDEK